jgi:hypothetical protein
MGIFKRNNKDKDTAGEEEVPQVDIFTPQMLAKRLLWDSVPCADVDKMIPLMNLVADSPEVREMEHRASHARRNKLLPLAELLDILTPLVSGITASAMLVNSGADIDAEGAAVLQRHHAYVVQTGVLALLANLLDMGIITYTDGVQLGEQLLGE